MEMVKTALLILSALIFGSTGLILMFFAVLAGSWLMLYAGILPFLVGFLIFDEILTRSRVHRRYPK